MENLNRKAYLIDAENKTISKVDVPDSDDMRPWLQEHLGASARYIPLDSTSGHVIFIASPTAKRGGFMIGANQYLVEGSGLFIGVSAPVFYDEYELDGKKQTIHQVEGEPEMQLPPGAKFLVSTIHQEFTSPSLPIGVLIKSVRFVKFGDEPGKYHIDKKGNIKKSS